MSALVPTLIRMVPSVANIALMPLIRIIILTALVITGLSSAWFAISKTQHGPVTVTGQVIEFEAVSLTTVSSLTIKDSEGKKWVFEVQEAFLGFTPSHLEEHRILRDPVTVEYELSETGSMSILSLSD